MEQEPLPPASYFPPGHAINGGAVPPGCISLEPGPDGTIKVPPIPCVPVMDKATATKNAVATEALGYLNFLQLPEVGKPKNTALALVAGGPSMKNYLEKIRTFRTIMSVSTTHDYLIERGI